MIRLGKAGHAILGVLLAALVEQDLLVRSDHRHIIACLHSLRLTALEQAFKLLEFAPVLAHVERPHIQGLIPASDLIGGKLASGGGLAVNAHVLISHVS